MNIASEALCTFEGRQGLGTLVHEGLIRLALHVETRAELCTTASAVNARDIIT